MKPPSLNAASKVRSPERLLHSRSTPGICWPFSTETLSETAATALTPPLCLRMTLAMIVRPCMSMPGAPPRITSMRTTWPAGIRLRADARSSCFDVGRSPSISTLPAAPANPRTCAPELNEKPGRRRIMSKAVVGRAALKKTGS